MHNIGFVIRVFETDGDLDHDVVFFVRIGERVISGTLDHVLLAIESEERRLLLEQEAEDLYDLMLEHMLRGQIIGIMEVNVLMRGRFSSIMLSGLSYPAPSFGSFSDLEQWLIEGMGDEPTATNPVPAR